MSFALCVVLAIDDMNGSGALHPGQGHGFEVVEPNVANLKACDFRDTKTGHSGQRGEQPVTVESHQLRAPPKQEGHDAFVDREFQTKGTAHETRDGFDPTGEDVTAGQRRSEPQKIVPMLNSRPDRLGLDNGSAAPQHEAVPRHCLESLDAHGQ